MGVETTTTEGWRVRRWRRLDPPSPGFAPWGLLPALGLAGVLLYGAVPFATDTIEAHVRERVRGELASRGMSWASVAVDGQDVTLRGQLPREGEGARALAVAEATNGATWLGPRDCTLAVRGEFEAPAPPPPPPPSAPAPRPAAAWQDWRFSLRGGALRLTGSVPDEATRAAVLARARSLVAPPRVAEVHDALAVTDRPAPDAARRAWERALDVLPRCEAGSVSLTAGTLVVRCDVTRATRDAVQAAAAAPLEGVRLGDVELLVGEDVTACEQAMVAILGASTINFETNSAVIAASNQPLLERVAAAARRCPGTLRIEGHTDIVGLRSANMTLSEARAAAVRTALALRGIPEARMRAQGFGPDRPVAPNTTPVGMARNRRIEIHVVHDGE